ncbi:MAG TPA: hypothetical protein V6C63_17630 [Allocoleopsis sp.]
MARKNKKLLSTLRALEDKQEPASNQGKLEEKSVSAPLNLAVTESERVPHQDLDADSPVIAPLLTSPRLEEQLGELAEEQLSELAAVPVATAESLYIADVTTPTETATLTEAEAPAEVEAPEAPPPDAEPELEATSASWDQELESEATPDAEPATSEALSTPALDPIETTPDPAEAASTVPQTIPQPTQAVAESINAQPTDHAEAVAEQPESSESAAEARQPAIATAQGLSQAELLQRPEAFALIVFTFFFTLWKAFFDLWSKPTTEQRSNPKKP